eukprot:CAMPEP_0184864952 /NCGR_PEP_ID=MMETSP0580-20130426/16488_1 /TAXON_ID=1118495 /ORGANISM="Dactyliosolen fragilissimus" /LENGTH=255 /DNA_ID=CAMNT_0027363929 /DNA_START=129 /DNA_END=896 /DNA_ORIENTATION=+
MSSISRWQKFSQPKLKSFPRPNPERYFTGLNSIRFDFYHESVPLTIYCGALYALIRLYPVNHSDEHTAILEADELEEFKGNLGESNINIQEINDNLSAELDGYSVKESDSMDEIIASTADDDNEDESSVETLNSAEIYENQNVEESIQNGFEIRDNEERDMKQIEVLASLRNSFATTMDEVRDKETRLAAAAVRKITDKTEEEGIYSSNSTIIQKEEYLKGIDPEENATISGRKRKLLFKVVKKCVMPWKKWSCL